MVQQCVALKIQICSKLSVRGSIYCVNYLEIQAEWTFPAMTLDILLRAKVLIIPVFVNF